MKEVVIEFLMQVTSTVIGVIIAVEMYNWVDKIKRKKRGY